MEELCVLEGLEGWRLGHDIGRYWLLLYNQLVEFMVELDVIVLINFIVSVICICGIVHISTSELSRYFVLLPAIMLLIQMICLYYVFYNAMNRKIINHQGFINMKFDVLHDRINSLILRKPSDNCNFYDAIDSVYLEPINIIPS